MNIQHKIIIQEPIHSNYSRSPGRGSSLGVPWTRTFGLSALSSCWEWPHLGRIGVWQRCIFCYFSAVSGSHCEEPSKGPCSRLQLQARVPHAVPGPALCHTRRWQFLEVANFHAGKITDSAIRTPQNGSPNIGTHSEWLATHVGIVVTKKWEYLPWRNRSWR